MLSSDSRLQDWAARLRRGRDVIIAFGRNPPEAVERARERIAERRDGRRAGAPVHAIEPDWERRVHERIGAPWPCPVTKTFRELWSEVISTLESEGLRVGRGTYAGWDDADELLARVVWCLGIHLKPQVAVETGVARGLTTRFLLEAMERNGVGRLFSIDLPPLTRRGQPDETGAAVPDSLRSRWTYVAGSSRRRLPALLNRLKRVDLFVHDSLHTTRNVLFELELVWQVLDDRGAIVVDDVDLSRGFELFTARMTDQWSVVGESQDRKRLLGFIVRSSPIHAVDAAGSLRSSHPTSLGVAST